MKEEIPNALIKIAYKWNTNQKAGGEGEEQQQNTQYLPPL